MALLLLAAILATLLGAPARVSAAPSVDTWVAPSPPQVESGSPCFHDANRQALTIVEMNRAPGRIWRLPDAGQRTWTPIDVAGPVVEGPRFRNWAYDPTGDRLFCVTTQGVYPPCCDDTSRARWYIEVYQLALGGPYTWEKIAVSDRPLERYGYSVAFDPTRNRLLVGFGVVPVDDGPDSLNTTLAALELSGTPHWTVLQTEVPPLPWSSPILLVDSVNDRLLAFGAFGPNNPRSLWSLPLAQGGAWEKVAVTDTLPNLPSSDGVSLMLDKVERRLLLFSNYYRPGDPADSIGLFQLGLDPGSGWRHIRYSGDNPRARWQMAMAHDVQHDRLYAYGGQGGYGDDYDNERSDVYELDGVDGGSWNAVHLSGRAREQGPGVSVVIDTRRHRALAFRGYGYNDRLEVATITQGQTQDWETPGIPSGSVPSGRSFAAAVYDSIEDRTLIFGGRLFNSEMGDLWQLTWPATLQPKWTRLFPEGNGPSPRWGAASVFDPVRRRIVLFGGFAGRAEADTWVLELNGQLRWRRLEVRGLPPSARFCASAVYDSRRDGMIVYGGNGNTEIDPLPLGDAWFLSFADGDAWVPMTIADRAPIARWMHAAMYDPVRDRMLVFWGHDRTGSRFDCAAIDLSSRPTWKAYAPSGPAADIRYGHAVAYDAVLDRAILIGGSRGSGGFYYRPLLDWYLDFAPGSATGPGPGPPLALLGMTPNPTNAGVDLAFDIPTAMAVRVRLYDARGRLVKSLDEKTYPPGRHLVHWDGNGEDGYRPRPGVYFARLVLGTAEFTGKVVLLR